MAVTAHWIEVDAVPTLQGTQYNLWLHTDLIGFHHVPGHHTGEHIAHAFLHVLDRIGVAHKVCNVSLSETFTEYCTFQPIVHAMLRVTYIVHLTSCSRHPK